MTWIFPVTQRRILCWLLICQLDINWSHLGRTNLDWQDASIRLPDWQDASIRLSDWQDTSIKLAYGKPVRHLGLCKPQSWGLSTLWLTLCLSLRKLCLSLFRKILKFTLSGHYLAVLLMPWRSLSTGEHRARGSHYSRNLLGVSVPQQTEAV